MPHKTCKHGIFRVLFLFMNDAAHPCCVTLGKEARRRSYVVIYLQQCKHHAMRLVLGCAPSCCNATCRDCGQ